MPDWNPDFEKLTPEEETRLEEAKAQIARGEYRDASEIDWDSES